MSGKQGAQTYPGMAREALRRHAEFHAESLTPPQKKNHRPRPQPSPLRRYTLKRGDEIVTVQTSTPHILQPATPGMRAMINALLIPEEVEVKAA